MAALWREHIVLKLTAMFLAVLLWLFIANEHNPVTYQVLPDVPLETRGLPAGMVVASIPRTVQVRLEGNRSLFEKVNYRDVQAYVNLREAVASENIFEVKIMAPLDLKPVEVIPSRVKVSMERMTRKSIPVHVELSGRPSAGYVNLTPEARPGRIILEGPEGLLQNIAKATVEAPLDDLEVNYEEDLPVTIKQADGTIPDERLFRLKPELVKVLVPVVSNLPSRTVPVRVMVYNSPAPGSVINRISVAPEVVRVAGPWSKIANLEYIETGTINLENVSSTLVQDLPLVKPEGVAITPDQQAHVVVEITGPNTD